MARRYQAWLKRRGIACPPTLTWRAHLAVTKDSQSKAIWPSAEEARLCNNFVQTYDRARFGADDGEAISRARELLEAIERRVSP
jgi:hypothetical protein